MSKRDWNKLASYLGAGLIVFALTIVGPITATLEYDSQRQIEDQRAADQREREATPNPERGLVEGSADPSANPSTPQAPGDAGNQTPEAFNWMQDTLAQWGMFGVSLVALAFSWWAVSLLGRTLKLQRQTTAAELRPYVHLARVNTFRHRDSKDDPAKTYVMEIVWKNSGQTPARRMRVHSTLRRKLEPLPEDYHFPYAEGEGFAGVAPLGPGEERAAPFPVRSINELVAAWRGVLHLHVYGWVEYSDGFPKTRRYRTEFAFQINVRGDPRQEVCEIEHEILDRHNGMDEECLFLPSTEE